ncbi:MAG: DNA internalization-related competence protein ComEC/Rec2 [Clostridia bacterium]|nr:DNA internalization-related competence protein ComEC/Rec2 [Clostridia bacterium]
MHTADARAFPSAWLLPLMTLGLVLGVALSPGADAWLPPAAALALSLAAALFIPGRSRLLALVLAAAATGSLLTIHASHPALPPEGEYTISGVVLDEVAIDEDGHMQTILGDVKLNGEPAAGKAWWTAYPEEDETLPDWLIPGTHVTFSGSAYHPQGQQNPGGYDFRLTLLADGVTLGVYGHEDLQPTGEPAGLRGAMAALRHSITMSLMDVMGPESGSLAAAMLLGEKTYLPDEDYAAFKALGILHILSVSGYHVGVLLMLLSLLLRPLPRTVRWGVLGAVLAFYALLTGAAPPVIRAGLLAMLYEAGHLQHRRNLPMHLLCLSAVLQLVINPLQLFSASFQLTYSAMLGLLLIYPRLRDVFLSPHPRLNWLWRGEISCLSVQLGLLPVQMHFFGGFTPATFLMNPLIIAISSLVMILYWVMLLLLPIPGLREAFGALTGQATEWMLAIIRFLAEVLGSFIRLPAPNALTLIGWAMLMAGLSVLILQHRTRLRRMLALCGAALLLLSLVHLPHTGTYYIQFSDGEADAALLHDRDTVVMIDAGESAYTVAAYLTDRCLDVDMLVLTHLHIDHVGGVQGLLDHGIPVRVCALPEGALLAGDLDEEALPLLEQLAQTGTQFVTLARGDVIDLPSGQLTVLWPQRDAVRTGQSANDTCLVLQADILGTTMLLTADLTSRYEMYAAIPADILKAAHHGSAGSTSPAFLQAVSPQVILLSCGKDEREAAFLPRAETIPVYSTHTSGAVTIHFTEDAFTVETLK